MYVGHHGLSYRLVRPARRRLAPRGTTTPANACRLDRLRLGWQLPSSVVDDGNDLAGHHAMDLAVVVAQAASCPPQPLRPALSTSWPST